MARPSRTPALTAATNFRTGGRSIFFSLPSFRQAIATAKLAPVMAAVRVPPSACKTSQSTQIVRGPSFSRSTTARSDRPIKRWISVLRPSIRPFATSRGFRVCVEYGSIEYSAVSQPPVTPCSFIHRGTFSSMVTPQITRVLPIVTSTEPPACGAMPKSNATERNSSSRRPSIRFMTAKVDRAQLLVTEEFLSANGLIMAEASFPHGARGGPGKKEPTSLNCQRFCQCRALQPAKEDRDRTKQLIIKRQPFHHRLDSHGHDVDREHLAAKEIFERVNDENDGRDFQNPERHHRQAVGDEELNQRRHDHRNRREEISQRIVRQNYVVAKVNEDQRDRRKCHERVNESAAQENAEPVGEVTHRLGQQRIDLAFANVGGDLPFVFRWRDQVAHQEREQIVINHRAVIVAVQLAAAFFEDGAPEKHRACQGNQSEKSAQK